MSLTVITRDNVSSTVGGVFVQRLSDKEEEGKYYIIKVRDFQGFYEERAG